MAKYGKFNYDPENGIEDILSQYKEYRTKDTKGMIKKEELDSLTLKLKEANEKLGTYTKTERQGLIKSAAAKINEAKSSQLVKYATFGEDFDFTDEKALSKHLSEVNKEIYGEVSDENSKHKTVISKPLAGEETKTESKTYRFMKN